jgi:lipid-A-disaccharide synthase
VITILLTAAEPSGDAIGASLMRAIASRRKDVRFVGAGGEAMRREGLEGGLDTSKLAVMGPMDALAALPRAKSLVSKLGLMAAAEHPAAGVMIDSWVFSKMVAERLRKTAPEAKLCKFAAPQVWASRPERAQTAATLFDQILCLLPFEPAWFEEAGGVAEFVGNPNFQFAASQPRSGPQFRARYALKDEPLLLLLPGSRMGEVKRLLPIYRETFEAVCEKVKGLRAAVIAAPSVESYVRKQVSGWDSDILIVPPDDRFNAFDAGDVALAASGTVSTELALTGTPMVVTYKVGRLTAAWARRVITSPYVTILNVAADACVVPERLQEDATPEQLSADIVRLFQDDEANRLQVSAFRKLLPQLLGSKNAADAAADAVLRLVDGQDRRDLNRGAAG